MLQVNNFNSLAEFGMYGAVLVVIVFLLSWGVRAFIRMFQQQQNVTAEMHREGRLQNQKMVEEVIDANANTANVAAEATKTIAAVNANLQQHRENEEVRHQILVKELKQTRHEMRDGFRRINDKIETRLPRSVGQAQSESDA